jgi:tetratricopeptide (TPR) repeat protein
MDEVRTEGETPNGSGEAQPVEDLNGIRSTDTAGTDLLVPRSERRSSRWLVQFGIGALVAGALVFGIGKRAELSSRVVLVQARNDMQNGRSYQAARALEVAYKKTPEDRALQVALIEAYYRAGEPERARPVQNKVVFTPEEEKTIQPLVRKVEEAANTLQQAVDLLREQQWSQALPLLQRAGKDMPDSPLPHAFMAQAYGGLYFSRQKPEDLQACLAAQRRLTEIDPKLAAEIKKRLGPIEVLPQVIQHTNAADAALKAGKTEDAVTELDTADRLYPNSAMVHALRAVLHAQRFEKSGDPAEKKQALEEYRIAVQLNPARVSMRSRLGKLAKEVADD